MGLFNFGKKAPQPVSRLDELKEIVTRDPSSHQFLALAEEYRKLGKTREQIDALERGLRANTTYVAAHVSLGRAYEQVGKNEDAIRSYQSALKQDPQNLVAIRQIADCFLRKGDKIEAIKKLKLYRGLKPGEKGVDEIIQQLDAELNPKPKEKPAPPPVIPPSSVKPGLLRRTSTYGVSGGTGGTTGGTSPGFLPPAGARTAETTGPIGTGAVGSAGLSTGEIRRVGAALSTGSIVPPGSSPGFLPPPLSPGAPPSSVQPVSLLPPLTTSPIPTSPITSPVQQPRSSPGFLPPAAGIPPADAATSGPGPVSRAPFPTFEQPQDAMELTFDGFRKGPPPIAATPPEPAPPLAPSPPPRSLSAPGFSLPEPRLGFSVTGSISLPSPPIPEPIQVPIIQLPPISAARPEPAWPVTVLPATVAAVVRPDGPGDGASGAAASPEPPPSAAVDLAPAAAASAPESEGWDVFALQPDAPSVPADEPAEAPRSGGPRDSEFIAAGAPEPMLVDLEAVAETAETTETTAGPGAEAARPGGPGDGATDGPASTDEEPPASLLEAPTPAGAAAPLVEPARLEDVPSEAVTQPPFEGLVAASAEVSAPPVAGAGAAEPEPLVSETLAELYRRQGYLEEARSTYELLARQEDDAVRASELLERAQHLGGPEPLEGPDAGDAAPFGEGSEDVGSAYRTASFGDADEVGAVSPELESLTPAAGFTVEPEPPEPDLTVDSGVDSIPYEVSGPRDEVLRLRAYLQRVSARPRPSGSTEISADSILEALVGASGVRFAAITDLGGVPVFSAGDPAGAPQEVLEELLSFRETVSRSGELLGAGDFVSVGLAGDGGLAILAAVAREWVLLVGAGTEAPAGRIRYEVGRAAARLKPLLAGDSLPVF